MRNLLRARGMEPYKKFQFVSWFPEWQGFHFVRLHKDKTDLAYIYDWCLSFAFWEIRKWHSLKPGELMQGLEFKY